MVKPNEKLEAARMKRRWSVALASEKVGVSVNTFNRWERGLQVPQLGTLDQLCKAFASSPEDLGFETVITAKRQPFAPSRLLTQSATSVSSTPSALSTTTASDLYDISSTGHSFYDQLLPSCTYARFEQTKRNLTDMHQLWHRHDSEETHHVSRRHALVALLCAPSAVFGLAHDARSPVLRPAEVLSLCEASIPLSWQLFFEGGILEVERLLPGYLSQLDTLVQHSAPQREQAASLASQGYQLASLIALQHQNFGLALADARQAFIYAEQVQDSNLLTASLIRQAQVHFYLQRARPRLQVYEQALQYSNKASPLLQGRVYIGLTETYSQLGHEQEALHFLVLAHRVFPTHCDADPGFAYTHFNHWSLTSFEGQTYLNLGQYRHAWELFGGMDKTIPTTLVPNRVELTVRQAATAVGLGDLEQSCSYVEAALHASIEAGNQLRYNEVYSIYETLYEKWQNEPRMHNLATSFAR
jgi:transcriptional regulator with XRE-family HTH domain/tetratricopeptide (TPR) repeat protein